MRGLAGPHVPCPGFLRAGRRGPADGPFAMQTDRTLNVAGGLARLMAVAALAASMPAFGSEWSMARPPSVEPGDPARGRALVADRQKGLCLLCHSAPIGDARQQGNLAPPLDGAGGRLNEGQLRLRMHDSRRINPESIMPAYGVADPAPQVAAAWRGKPIFTAQQIEDVVAWLVTLK